MVLPYTWHIIFSDSESVCSVECPDPDLNVSPSAILIQVLYQQNHVHIITHSATISIKKIY